MASNLTARIIAGAFAAQRRLRHKCAKGSFQAIFWMIVFLYQFAAIEVLQNWKISRSAVKTVESLVKHYRS